MVAGHALLAFPADYGDTGVMSFMVGEARHRLRGRPRRRHPDRAAAIDSFDPGDGWTPVEEDAE